MMTAKVERFFVSSEGGCIQQTGQMYASSSNFHCSRSQNLSLLLILSLSQSPAIFDFGRGNLSRDLMTVVLAVFVSIEHYRHQVLAKKGKKSDSLASG